MCHHASEGHVWQCQCGYEFGQTPEKAIELLLGQRRNLRVNLLLLLAVDTAIVGALIASLLAGGPVIISGFVFGALAIQTGRTAHKLAITRDSLEQMRARQLPKATLLRE